MADSAVAINQVASSAARGRPSALARKKVAGTSKIPQASGRLFSAIAPKPKSEPMPRSSKKKSGGFVSTRAMWSSIAPSVGCVTSK